MAETNYADDQYAYNQEYPNGSNNTELDDSDDDEDLRKIFVGGLSPDTTEDDLKQYFGKFGEVSSAVVKYDKMTGVSRGFAFVSFGAVDNMKKTLEQTEHVIKNKKVDPKPAQPTKEFQKKIFVGGISPDASEQQIKDYFQKFGRIEKLDLPFDTSKDQRKPFVFVTFHSEKGAKRAIAEEKQHICGKDCDVKVAVVKPQNARSSNGRGGYGGYGYSQQGGGDYYSGGYDNYGYPQNYGYDQGYYGANYGYGGYSGYGYQQGGSQGGYQHAQQGQSAPRGGAAGGGKMRGGGGRGGAAAGGSYHPYPRQ